MDPDTVIRRNIDNIYQQQSRRVLATLIRLLGSFDLAEQALQDAFAAAVQQWPVEGIPDNPAAWLIKPANGEASTSSARSRRPASIYSNCHPKRARPSLPTQTASTKTSFGLFSPAATPASHRKPS
ncbi:sigma factor [Marinobacter changyiensis]|uniref:sigma factor n=1 Tax=Marinobacter changyiensis TaxID=2604091 RepID=UPI001FEA31C6|nr:sigma factor [Marinobacter changyiensis]